jgi:hypothetical protein
MYTFLKIILILYLFGLNIYGSSVKPLFINKNIQIKISEIEKKYQSLKRSMFSSPNDYQTNYNIYLESLTILTEELKEVRSNSFEQAYDFKLEREYLDELSILDKKSKKLINVIVSLINTFKEYNPSIHIKSYPFESYRNNI